MKMNREQWERRLESLELLIQGAILEFEADTGIKIFEIHINAEWSRDQGPGKLVDITVDT